MAERGEIAREPDEISRRANSCPACNTEIDAKEEIKNRDRIADGLLRLCAIINGTWNDILASVQSVSFLRETALFIDCSILAIWKKSKTVRTKSKRKH